MEEGAGVLDAGERECRVLAGGEAIPGDPNGREAKRADRD
jgi:hypothetical protein